MVNRITGGPEGDHRIQIRGNFGMYQRSLSQLAVALDNDDPSRGMTTDQMVDWLMAGDGGEIRDALWNTFYRDGHSGESSSSYSRTSASALFVVANALRKVGVNLLEQQPKMKRLATVYLDLAVLGRHTPSIGDAGSLFGSERVGWLDNLFLPVFETTGSPRLGQALSEIGLGEGKHLWSNPPIARVRKPAKSFPDAWPRRDRVLGGYGTAIIESKTQPVGMSLYYGYSGGGHGHYDNLNIELFAFGKPMLPDLGYPHPLGDRSGYNKRMAWTSGTVSHYGVVVNRQRQATARGYTTKRAGDLHTLLGTGGVQYMDVHAHQAYPQKVNVKHRMKDARQVKGNYPDHVGLYRRTSLLIDQPGGMPYLFDLFRVQGGWEHAWSFHGPPNTRFEPINLHLSEQGSGTLAGPDVKFGERPKPPTHASSGFQYLTDIRKAQAPDDQSWGARWLDEENDENLRLTVLSGSPEHVAIGLAEPEKIKQQIQPIPYILAFNGSPKHQGQDLGSDFAAVVEPYKAKPTIATAKRLTSRGAAHGVAAEVQRRGGRDIILSTLNERDRIHAQVDNSAMTLEGELALVRQSDQDQGRATSEILTVNAHRLRTPRVMVRQPQLLMGRITSVDYQKRTVSLDQSIASPKTLVGRTITFRGDDHGEAYDIKAAKTVDGQTRLTLDAPLIVGTGKVKSIPGSGTLTTDTRFNWQTVDGGDHTGRMLLGPNKERGLKILKPVRDGKFKLDGSASAMRRLFMAHPDNNAASEGETEGQDQDKAEAKRQFWIGSIGNNDPWRIPTYVHVQLNQAQGYRIRLNAPAQITLTLAEPDPKSIWQYKDAAGNWKSLKITRPEPNQVRFQLSPADLNNARTTVRSN